MHASIQSRCAGRRGRGLVLAVLLIGAARVMGGDFPMAFAWQDLEFKTYAPNSIREIADCKVGKVFLDHRKIGFFRVKLLPVLVVQGVRLEFGEPAPTNEWAQSFQSDWLPKAGQGSVEWRDVSIGSRSQGSPRLHAGVAQLTAGGATAIGEFRDVVLEANGVTARMKQAQLRNENGRPLVVWQVGDSERRMDLFSGELVNNPESKGAKE
jgi:hypothetical protein